MEFAYFKMDIAEVDDARGIVTGHVSIFNEPLEDRPQVFRPGTFKQTLRHTKGKWPIYKLHDPYLWIGNSLNAEETERGLYAEMQLLIDEVPEARSEFALLRHTKTNNRPAGFSIGYNVIKQRVDPKTQLQENLETAVAEISTCPPGFHAAPNALVEQVRAAQLGLAAPIKIEELLALVERYRERQGGLMPLVRSMSVLRDALDGTEAECFHSICAGLKHLNTILEGGHDYHA